jgi:hypothetical protein
VPDGDYQLRDVKLEKTEFCANEDVRVTIDAADPTGDSRWVASRVKVVGEAIAGRDVIMRVGPEFQDFPAHFPTQEVEVEVKDTRNPGIVATRKIPITIKPCQAPNAGLAVVCSLRPDAAETIACTAGSGREDRALPFKPVRYEWTFIEPANGQPVTTTRPTLNTTIPLPLPETSTVSMIVAARAIGPAGETMEGRGSISVENRYFLEREDHQILGLYSDFISTPLDDKKPKITVKLGNPHAEAITLDKVDLTTVTCGDDPTTSPARTVSPAEILGTNHLAGGQTISFEWSLPGDPQRCSARADITGHGDTSGMIAQGVFIMTTDTKARKKLSAADSARMAAALKILSQRRGHRVMQITPIELHELQEEGLVEELDGP